MTKQQNNTKNKSGMLVGVTIVVLALLAVAAYAAYMTFSASTVTPTDTIVSTPDISPGDIVSDIDPLTGVPESGNWSFKLDVGNPGSAYVTSAADGRLVTMNLDGQTLSFFTTSLLPPYTYKTNPRSFELQTPDGGTSTGYAYYEFVAVDSDMITGVLVHDTDVLGATSREFTMELIDAELVDPDVYELTAGAWSLDYHDVETDCDLDPAIAGFPDLPTDADLQYQVDFDTGGDSNDLQLTLDGDIQLLNQTGETNTYSSGSDGIDAGNPIDAAGDALFDYQDDTFTAEYNTFATGPDTMEGYVEITSTNSCSYTVGFSGTAN